MIRIVSYKKITNFRNIFRVFCDDPSNTNLSTVKKYKVDKIGMAIKLHLENRRRQNMMITKEREEYEFGRRYLAKMMGADPLNFTQKDVDEAIEYLFPSNLDQKARPLMSDPSNIHQKNVILNCDESGRPNNSFHYSLTPNFNKIMHDLTYSIEKVKKLDDDAARNITVKNKKIELSKLVLMTKSEISHFCNEEITTSDHKKWSTLMNKLIQHRFSDALSEFILKYHKPYIDVQITENIPQLQVDPETGQQYAEGYGQKKWTFSEVRVYMPGEGKFAINGKSLTTVVPKLSDRETIMFPLSFTDTLDKVDIVAQCKITGSSCLSLSLRLAISRALTCFLDNELVSRMRLAGLLTQDDRFREAKKPGQPKARKKAPWRPR